MFNFKILPENTNASLEFVNENNGVYLYKLRYLSASEKIIVITHTECINCFSVWNQSVDFDRQLRPEWNSSKCITSILKGMPIHTLIGQNGENTITVALSDSKNRFEIKSGIHEEDASVTIKIEIYPPESKNIFSETLIRIDTRKDMYYDVIGDVLNWWEDEFGYSSMNVPQSAKKAMYSSWYSFHQMLSYKDILSECKMAKELGMETIILDDGWQTDDNSRGYAYCGDWECAPSKVGNMKDLVNDVHKLGMKIMLWYNIAFMGINSKNVSKFKGMYLTDEINGRYTLDPRYKQVRNYLIELFSQSLKQWNLDGLKIDFVDSFIRSENDKITPDMDYPVLEDAVEKLMEGIKDALLKINGDVMIEFRQNYMGALMQKNANIFRVADCPNDSLRNRIGVINLRLTTKNAAVHSDMLMWNKNEPSHICAKQIINVLFSVPQISVRIAQLNNEHYKMLKFYLGLWNDYTDLFINSKIIPKNPDANFSSVVSKNNKQKMVVLYSDLAISTSFDDINEMIVVNGSENERIYIEQTSKKSLEYTVYDCMGNIVDNSKTNEALFAINIPVSGVLKIKSL